MYLTLFNGFGNIAVAFCAIAHYNTKYSISRNTERKGEHKMFKKIINAICILHDSFVEARSDYIKSKLRNFPQH